MTIKPCNALFLESVQHLYNIQSFYLNNNLTMVYPSFNYVPLPLHGTIKYAADALYIDPICLQNMTYSKYHLVQLKLNTSAHSVREYISLYELSKNHFNKANIINVGFTSK